jgi:hypothetical protein
MNRNRRTTAERLRRLLDRIKGEVESLKVEGQSVCVEQLERGVVSIELALENLCRPVEPDYAGTTIDVAQMTFEVWRKQETRKGVAFASLADAAAAYEAAGYKWLKD